MLSSPRSRTTGQWVTAATVAVVTMVVIVVGRRTLGLSPILTAVSEEPNWLALSGLVLTVVIIAAAIALPARLPWALRTGAMLGGYAAAVVLLAMGAAGVLDGGGDARILYDHPLPDPYSVAYEDLGFAYSPAAAQALFPFVQLPWGVFLGGWTALLIVALVRLVGPAAPLLMLAPFVALDVWYANVNLFLAYAIAMGLSRSAWWALVLHTKVTPGVGLVWFLVRREWGRLAVALALTVAIAAASFVLAPNLWSDWLGLLSDASASDEVPWLGPLWLRLVAAALLVAWGGLTDRPWTVAVGAFLGIPVPWPATATLLLAAVPLTRRASLAPRRRAVDRALAPRSR